jgi:hypothetical protein
MADSLVQEATPEKEAGSLLGRLNWKHGLVAAALVAIYLYPKPLIKLCMPLAELFNHNHPSVKQISLPL